MKALNTHKCKLLALSVCLIPAAGFAADAGSDDLSYGYVEADYINFDVDQPNEDSIFSEDFDNGGGYGISLSLPLGENFFIYGDYSDTESDFTFIDNADIIVPGNTDVLKFSLGAGFIMPMSTSTDLVFSGGYSDIDWENFDFGATDDDSVNDLDEDPSDGFSVDVKLRSQLTEMLEGSVGARYTNIQDVDGVSFIGNLMFEFSPNWGLNLLVDAGDELVTWGAGVRYSF